VRRYPIFVCVRTEYERRLDGIGTPRRVRARVRV
jgi:hypothetical protein